MDRVSMEKFFTGIDEKPFRAEQVTKWIYHQGQTSFSEMTNLSLQLRQQLAEISIIEMPELVKQQVSVDGTCKWLLRIDENNCIESVYIPEPDRGTLCISSQVGCPLDCSFCSTAKQGFNRNLSVAEIISQLWLANHFLGHFKNGQRYISNVVFMGMGEPLLNFDNVITSINLMIDDLAFGLSKKKITLSTSGIVPGIYKLAETSSISLAISLHATNNELRDILVPVNRKYPIEELMQAVKYYSRKHSDAAITIEYVMLDNINDSPAEARHLVSLLKNIPVKVNLIPFNTFPGAEYHCSPRTVIDRFREILINAGIITITRKTRGDDIDAACGQLAGNVMPRSRRHQQKMVEYNI